MSSSRPGSPPDAIPTAPIDTGYVKGQEAAQQSDRENPIETTQQLTTEKLEQAGEPTDRKASVTDSRQGSPEPEPHEIVENENQGNDGNAQDHGKSSRWGLFRLRPDEDDEPQDWWFASTAIPLIAATAGPMANVMSIAALVTSWRNHVVQPDPAATSESTSEGYQDPHWCISLNITSLVCGFVGNLFLLFNFTKAIRYIIALPMTIILWYAATGILMGITICMHKYAPPKDGDIYSQGFWHAVIAACLYMMSSILLGINMLGYFLGHYPRHFALTDDQRNLILQTMMFFAWLAMGGALFSNILSWSFADALYFCDVTILTVGFGDYYATNDLARGLVFPYSVGGIVILGLMVSSIHRFAGELGQDNIVGKHADRRRKQTVQRTLTISAEERIEDVEKKLHLNNDQHPSISKPFDPRPLELRNQSPAFKSKLRQKTSPSRSMAKKIPKTTLRKTLKVIKAPSKRIKRVRDRKSKVLVMREERDRFNAMRDIQKSTSTFKKWYALGISVTAFGILWCVGAVGFWKAEQRTQQMTYFQALYFCYVSLLTIGYGDLSPKSNAGKPLFLVWSLVAVPTMTILISDMGDTIIASFKRGTFVFADFTVMPKKGIYRALMMRYPWLWNWVQRKAEKRRIEQGFVTGFGDNEYRAPSLDELAGGENFTESELTRKLAFAIRRIADDLMKREVQRYSYEEWVEFTRLIRFTSDAPGQLEEDEEEHGIIEWDWIGEDSPMMSNQSETEWVLDRLCESLLRLLKKGDARDQLGSAVRDVPMLQRGPPSQTSSKVRTYDGTNGYESSRPSNGKAEANDLGLDGDAGDIDKCDDSTEAARPVSRRTFDRSRRRPSLRSIHQNNPHSVDPMHRGIGLYPELDTSPLRSPESNRAISNDRSMIGDRRRSSGMASARSESGYLDVDRGTRRRSSASPSPGRLSGGLTVRKGPFSALPTAKRSQSAFRTLKHRTYVN